MLLFSHAGKFNLYPENLAESKLLEQPDASSRLAFVRAGELPGNVDIWHLCPGDMPAMDWKKRTGFFPCTCGVDKEFLYWLRIFMDHIAIYMGFLPMHCAVVARGEKVVFIFAPSGGGKSLIARKLSLQPAGYELICDDHCLAGASHMHGNSICRIRKPDGNSYCHALGEKNFNPQATIAAFTGFGCNYMEKVQWQQFASCTFYKTAMKYIAEAPRAFPVKLDCLFGVSVRKKVMPLLLNFLAELRGCYHISGDIAFLTRQITSLPI